MQKILIIADYYLPGYKGGGPIRTIANMIDWLGDEFEFYILTRDRDLGDSQVYDGITSDTWIPVGKAKVRYLTPQEMTWTGLAQVIRDIDYDLLYINSFFSTFCVKIMWLRKLGFISRETAIIAPRGEFYEGALGLKKAKKRVYVVVARLLSIYRDVALWQASTADEINTIHQVAPQKKLQIHVAPNLLPKELSDGPVPQSAKSEVTKIVFLSRIARKKNLDYALKVLAQVKDNVQFDIYGSMENPQYWQECQQLAKQLPSNIQMEYKGKLAHQYIYETFAQYHLFLLPTRGENFGHVIWEALYAGCPVLISDQTPWHHLEESGIGWDVSLDSPGDFVKVIERVIAMDAETHRQYAQAAHEYALQLARDEAILKANRQLFLYALEMD